MKRLFQFVLLVIFPIIAHAQNIQNIVRNGSFEGDFHYWAASGEVYFSTHLASAGQKSYGVSTNVDNHGFIYQILADSLSSFESSFWVFPQSDTYRSTFELVANWDRSTADLISRFVMKQDSIRITTLDTDTTIAYTMQLNNWHEFSILTDSLGWYKEYHINGDFICSQKSSRVLSVETIIIGDVSDRGQFGALHYDDIIFLGRTDSTVTNIIDNETYHPDQFSLKQNYPNPFNPRTTIEFTLSEPGHIRLSIYNNRGQQIRKLMDENKRIGTYSIHWNGMNDDGQKVSSGTYYLRLETSSAAVSKKIILLK